MNIWTDAEAAYKMYDIYQQLADETDSDFVARKLTEITVHGELCYQIADLMVWEDAQGNIAFIDYDCMCVGVFCEGIAYAIPMEMLTTDIVADIPGLCDEMFQESVRIATYLDNALSVCTSEIEGRNRI